MDLLTRIQSVLGTNGREWVQVAVLPSHVNGSLLSVLAGACDSTLISISDEVMGTLTHHHVHGTNGAWIYMSVLWNEGSKDLKKFLHTLGNEYATSCTVLGHAEWVPGMNALHMICFDGKEMRMVELEFSPDQTRVYTITPIDDGGAVHKFLQLHVNAAVADLVEHVKR